jgi:hypothetical protein
MNTTTSIGERKTLDYHLKTDDFESVSDLSFIRLIIRTNPKLDQKNQRFCAWYVLGKNWKNHFQRKSFNHPQYTKKETNMKKNDLIVYFNEFNEWTHIGKISKNQKIISKWGSGYVYEHSLWQIPTFYGTTYKLFRCKN